MGFEPTISAGERPKTYALDGAATGNGNYKNLPEKKNRGTSPTETHMEAENKS